MHHWHALPKNSHKMSLLQLPNTIWRDIFVSWLGELREIIRVYCASHFDCARQSTTPLREAFSGQAFRFFHGAQRMHLKVLKPLCAWMQSRNVYISQLKLPNLEKFPLLQWETLLTHTAGALRDVTFGFRSSGSLVFLSWASIYLKQLQHFKVTGHVAAFPGRIQQIVDNNSQSLVSVIFDGCTDSCDPVETTCTSFPCLKVLQWLYAPGSKRFNLVRGSPNLVALSVFGSSCSSESIASTIAECCPLLERLQLCRFELKETALLRIARGCPRLQYLKLWDHFGSVTGAFADVLRALPHLHTLVMNGIYESVLLALAATGHPSLRILDADVDLTYTDLRTITAALPQLTGFAVYELNSTHIDMFEHCGNLEHLELHLCRQPADTVNAVLLSVATYCHNLHTLVLGNETAYSDRAVNTVIESCPKLRRLQTSVCSDRTGLISRPGLVASREQVAFAEWAPEWSSSFCIELILFGVILNLLHRHTVEIYLLHFYMVFSAKYQVCFGQGTFRSNALLQLYEIHLVDLQTNSMMSNPLLQLPHAIWRDISVSWLGDIRDVICVDSASHCDTETERRSSSSLPDAIAGQIYRFPDGADRFRCNVLKSLCSWMRSRNVFISQLKLPNLEKCPHLEWEVLLAHTAVTLKNVSFGFKGADSMVLLSWASIYLKQLQFLKITGQVATFPRHIQQIIDNNSKGLVSLIFDGCTDFNDATETTLTLNPCLKVLQWMYAPGSKRFQLLRGSPNLVALSVSGFSNFANSLVAAITECCPLLERLQLCEYRLDDAVLLQLVHGCPRLQYLKLWDHKNTVSFALTAAVRALPYLHTLIINGLQAVVVLDLAAAGHPSLSILDTGHTPLTYAELRQVTTALPQLTGLVVHEVDAENANMFAHCGNMEQLELRRCRRSTSFANAALLSVAAHCPHLHTLVLGDYFEYSPSVLNIVIRKCLMLRRVKLAAFAYIQGVLIGRPGLVISNEVVEFAEWAPEWIKS